MGVALLSVEKILQFLSTIIKEFVLKHQAN